MQKVCKKHGELNHDQVVKNRKGVLVCKKCRNNYAEEWREKNKEKTRLKAIKYRELAAQNKLTWKCKIHGDIEGKNILINIRASRMCGICIREKALDKHRKQKSLQPKTEYQILREEKIKGNCKIHGENVRTKTGKQSCKLCRQESSIRWRNKHPDKVKEMNEKLRLKRNEGKYKENQRKVLEFRKNENIDAYRKQQAAKAKKYRENLPDAYIKQTIRMQRIFKKDNIKIPIEIIPKELVEIKRLHLKLKKQIKDKNNGD